MSPTRLHLRSCTGAVALIGSVALSGCYTAIPPSDQAGFVVDKPLTMAGYSLSADRTVVVMAASAPHGAFVEVPGARARSSAGPSAHLDGGRAIYDWSVSAVVPDSLWGAERDGDDCSTRVTYLLAGEPARRPSLLRPSLSPTYFKSSGVSEAQAACLNDKFNGGADVTGATAACLGVLTPLRLVAINRHVGNVVLDSPLSLEALRCTDQIDGSLTVVADAATAWDVDLPRLKRVTGNVNLVYTMRANGDAPGPMRCGAAVAPGAAISRMIRAPRLTYVGGDLNIETRAVGYERITGGENVEIGLNALAEVKGAIDLRFDLPNQPCGLDALAAHAGTIHIDSRFESTGFRFLRALRSVGRLDVARIGSVFHHFSSLESAGSMRLANVRYWFQAFPALREIRGDLELDNAHLDRRLDAPGGGRPPAPLLTRIGGTLRIINADRSSLGIGASAGLVARSLVMVNNRFDCLFPGTERGSGACTSIADEPSAVSLRLLATGNLRIADNPSLPASEVCRLVALLRSRGFAGPADLGDASCL